MLWKLISKAKKVPQQGRRRFSLKAALIVLVSLFPFSRTTPQAVRLIRKLLERSRTRGSIWALKTIWNGLLCVASRKRALEVFEAIGRVVLQLELELLQPHLSSSDPLCGAKLHLRHRGEAVDYTLELANGDLLLISVKDVSVWRWMQTGRQAKDYYRLNGNVVPPSARVQLSSELLSGDAVQLVTAGKRVFVVTSAAGRAALTKQALVVTTAEEMDDDACSEWVSDDGDDGDHMSIDGSSASGSDAGSEAGFSSEGASSADSDADDSSADSDAGDEDLLVPASKRCRTDSSTAQASLSTAQLLAAAAAGRMVSIRLQRLVDLGCEVEPADPEQPLSVALAVFDRIRAIVADAPQQGLHLKRRGDSDLLPVAPGQHQAFFSASSSCKNIPGAQHSIAALLNHADVPTSVSQQEIGPAMVHCHMTEVVRSAVQRVPCERLIGCPAGAVAAALVLLQQPSLGPLCNVQQAAGLPAAAAAGNAQQAAGLPAAAAAGNAQQAAGLPAAAAAGNAQQPAGLPAAAAAGNAQQAASLPAAAAASANLSVLSSLSSLQLVGLDARGMWQGLAPLAALTGLGSLADLPSQGLAPLAALSGLSALSALPGLSCALPRETRAASRLAIQPALRHLSALTALTALDNQAASAAAACSQLAPLRQLSVLINLPWLMEPGAASALASQFARLSQLAGLSVLRPAAAAAAVNLPGHQQQPPPGSVGAAAGPLAVIEVAPRNTAAAAAAREAAMAAAAVAREAAMHSGRPVPLTAMQRQLPTLETQLAAAAESASQTPTSRSPALTGNPWSRRSAWRLRGAWVQYQGPTLAPRFEPFLGLRKRPVQLCPEQLLMLKRVWLHLAGAARQSVQQLLPGVDVALASEPRQPALSQSRSSPEQLGTLVLPDQPALAIAVHVVPAGASRTPMPAPQVGGSRVEPSTSSAFATSAGSTHLFVPMQLVELFADLDSRGQPFSWTEVARVVDEAGGIPFASLHTLKLLNPGGLSASSVNLSTLRAAGYVLPGSSLLLPPAERLQVWAEVIAVGVASAESGSWVSGMQQVAAKVARNGLLQQAPWPAADARLRVAAFGRSARALAGAARPAAAAASAAPAAAAVAAGPAAADASAAPAAAAAAAAAARTVGDSALVSYMQGTVFAAGADVLWGWGGSMTPIALLSSLKRTLPPVVAVSQWKLLVESFCRACPLHPVNTKRLCGRDRRPLLLGQNEKLARSLPLADVLEKMQKVYLEEAEPSQQQQVKAAFLHLFAILDLPPDRQPGANQLYRTLKSPNAVPEAAAPRGAMPRRCNPPRS